MAIIVLICCIVHFAHYPLWAFIKSKLWHAIISVPHHIRRCCVPLNGLHSNQNNKAYLHTVLFYDNMLQDCVDCTPPTFNSILHHIRRRCVPLNAQQQGLFAYGLVL